MVNIYACKAATNSSNNDNANANPNDKELPTHPLKMNIIPKILINTTCPAVMFAYKRIIKENGLIIVPNNSIGAKINFIGIGTPGIQKICPQ